MKPARTWIIAGIALLAFLVAAPVVIWLYTRLDFAPLAGIRVGGIAVPTRQPLAPYLEERARVWAGQSLELRTGYHVWRPTRAELGAGLAVDEALEEVRAVGHSQNPLVVLGDWWRSHFGGGHDLPWRPRIRDGQALESYVQTIRAAVDRAPTPGSFDPDDRPIPGLAGEALDVVSTKRAIQGAIARGAKVLEVKTLVTPPPQSFKRFVRAQADTSVLMMRQETDYRAGNKGRANNIELAARKLDGAVLMPGAQLSFNELVGKRDLARGFAPALELINGEVAMGVGGGVCQVAGTLHAAAFFAGLKIEEFRPHSRLNQLAYLRPGLDTMVAWPDHVTDLRETKDLKLRNPYPFPIKIRTAVLARAAGTRVVRVELYGSAKPFRVDWSFEELERVPANEIRRTVSSLRRGQQQIQQDSLQGLVIMRKRVIYTPTARIQEDVRVAYPPTPRIVLVGSS
ncbi:MAG: Vancomycin B-type resistance protein VanW [Myxococcaceae bacterium]|nr:Vancomycin B-type resistance protein VanW [Myxococcaceae bacterium]